MVGPAFLANPEVIAWLDGVEPAWTLLDFESYCALADSDPVDRGAIAFEASIPSGDFSASAILHNARILLAHAAESDGIALTATGNLTRRSVAQIIPAMSWPGFDVEGALRFCKVVNEPDFLPLHYLHLLTQTATPPEIQAE